ncbi:DUF4249 domain-containing protein [Flavobacteriaceae bacterium]|nr:DUF4249 domain-containing protein [Bacteroidota bacterium]MDC3312825.1 DUF4249 domain-containing protein [Flavobacteriaceae bacterium]
MLSKIMTTHRIIFLLNIVVLYGCVEEIDIVETDQFENYLVVEATLTDQEISQEISLSRTYSLEDNVVPPESNADVKVTDSNGVEYSFEELSPGQYRSAEIFAAQPNINYTLTIRTQNGNLYESREMLLTSVNPIDELFFERDFNENGQEGVSVFVNNYDPLGQSNFYRFKYEESYKVIAPLWTSLDLIDNLAAGVASYDERFEFIPRSTDELICYKTNVSNSIIITNTKDLIEDRLNNFRVLFLNRNDFKIAHRYSILLTQFIQSAEAYTFYQFLSEISESENLLSETQPGFLSGNITSLSNTEENVIGFFEVVSADTQRIYFNYEDLFSNELLPPYPIQCGIENFYAPLFDQLDEALASRDYKFYLNNDEPEELEGPYFLVPAPCGDCTFYGDSSPPVWWEE